MLKSVWLVKRHWMLAEGSDIICCFPEKEFAEQLHKKLSEENRAGYYSITEVPFFRHYDEFLEQQGE